MSRKQTLEQRISNLINEYGLAEVKRCVDMASYLMQPAQPKKTPHRKVKLAVASGESPQ